jgi:hypothetical protein
LKFRRGGSGCGWDKVLPHWFGRFDPTPKTLTNSIPFVSAVALAMAMAGVVDAGERQAFPLLQKSVAMRMFRFSATIRCDEGARIGSNCAQWFQGRSCTEPRHLF